MSYYLGTILTLSVGIVLLVVADRRDWHPSISVTLAIGLALRAVILAVVWHHAKQPLDFIHDFQVTGQAVLHHQDPIGLPLNRFGFPTWNYLPLMAYVFAIEQFLVHHLGIPWTVLGRILPIAADLALIVMVGRLAPSKNALRSFQYACNPIALLACAVHGQIEPIALAFAVGGFLAARARKPIMAGALLGFAVAAKSWPVILIPGMLLVLRSWRERLTATIVSGLTIVAFFVTLPLAVNAHLMADAKVILGYRSIPGQFGWTGVAGSLLSHARFVSLSQTWLHIGAVLSLAAMAGAFVLWRRADGEDAAAAMALAFLIVTAGFGMQYLAWPMPFIVSRPSKFTQPFIVGAGIFAAFGYLYLGNLTGPAYQTAFKISMFVSVGIVVLLAAAMPWSRRAKASGGPDVVLSPEGAYA
jgi:Glycosyltransferase family 87